MHLLPHMVEHDHTPSPFPIDTPSIEIDPHSLVFLNRLRSLQLLPGEFDLNVLVLNLLCS